MNEFAFRVEDLHRTYYMKGETVHALAGSHLMFGTVSTLPSWGRRIRQKHASKCLGCLDRPTQGKYLLAGQDVAKINDHRIVSDSRTAEWFLYFSRIIYCNNSTW